MNSQRIYDKLIEHRQQNLLEKNGSGYTENHHIIPKCMGGSDNKENLVRLTAREHFVAHWLLWKIYKNTEYGDKMALAFKRMIDAHKGIVGSRKFAEARKAVAAAKSGEKHPMSKLSDVQRQEIRDLYREGCWTQKELAEKFGVSQQQIHKILK